MPRLFNSQNRSNMTTRTTPPSTRDDIRLCKEELSQALHQKGEEIDSLWHDVFVPQKSSTKGELITSIISNSITAFDAFMLVRKLMHQYGSLFTRKKHRR